MESQIVTLEGELQGKDEKIAQFDAQVSLAIGERDAVQLEARTQVEDFEEKIKVMQEQLQKVIDLKFTDHSFGHSDYCDHENHTNRESSLSWSIFNDGNFQSLNLLNGSVCYLMSCDIFSNCTYYHDTFCCKREAF